MGLNVTVPLATLGLGISILGALTIKQNKPTGLSLVALGNGIMIFSLTLKGI